MNKFLRNLVFIFILAVLMLASFPGYASA